MILRCPRPRPMTAEQCFGKAIGRPVHKFQVTIFRIARVDDEQEIGV
jgi:hypothetical protein